MTDSVLTNYTQSGPVVANGTVGTTINSIIIRSPVDQRAALNVYSTDQANMLFLPVSSPPGSSATMTSNINMSGNGISNIKAPQNASDAANKAYVDTTTVSLSGDTMTGPLQMNNNAVTGLPVPQNSTDAASKNYVDTKFMIAAGPNNVTGSIQMNNNIIAGLPAPQNAGDAANKNYVDTTTVSIFGDTMTGDLHMSNNRITDLPNVPAAATDAVNKIYVDAAVAAGVASVSSGPGYLPLTGTGNSMLTGAINMGGNLINAVLAPVVATDAANKLYVDTQDAAKLSRSGSLAMTGALNMGAQTITNLATPLAATDAATKAYVDSVATSGTGSLDGYLPLSGSATMTGALNMGGQLISNLASMTLNGTSSSDALTLSKATGGSAYALTLPSAAPASNTFLKYDGANYAWSAPLTPMTPISLSGVQNALFTNIPSYANRITVVLDNVAIGAAQVPLLQVGSGSIQTTDCQSYTTKIGAAGTIYENVTNGFQATTVGSSASGHVCHGCYVLVRASANVWICTGTFMGNNSTTQCSGRINVTGVLDRVQLSTTGGTVTFTMGVVSLMYE